MVASHNLTRINTLELKELIYKRIGQERASQYYHHLIKYFSAKLSKAEFEKSCIQIIGKENLSLHNRLIRAILQNAVPATAPPQKSGRVEPLGVKDPSGGSPKNNLLHGGALPRKCRSPHGRPSPRGPLGKSPSIMTCEEGGSRMQEQQSPSELQTLNSRPQIANASESEEAVSIMQERQTLPTSERWSSIAAPLGVSVDFGSARQAPYLGSLRHSYAETCLSSGELPDTKSLGRRVLKKLALKGVGISLDGANMLNKGLDVYMKKVILQCTKTAGCMDPRTIARESSCQMVSGYRDMAMQPTCPSMVDFRAAMEANLSILGENGPAHLEMISNYATGQATEQTPCPDKLIRPIKSSEFLYYSQPKLS